MAMEAPNKPIHSLILDTGSLIKNAVSISTIINSAEEIFTTSAIISEIRDEATRSRVQTTLMPFLKIKNPSPASYDAVIAFAKKTGDHAVLSRQDLGILALAYEVHCERNGGPWRLREAPKQPVKVRPGEEEKVEEKEFEENKLDEPKLKKEKKGRKGRKKLAMASHSEISEHPVAEQDLTQHQSEVITLGQVPPPETVSIQEQPTEQTSTHVAPSEEEKTTETLAIPEPKEAEQQPVVQTEQKVEQAASEKAQQSPEGAITSEKADEQILALEAHKEEQDIVETGAAPPTAQETVVVEGLTGSHISQQQETGEQTSTHLAQEDSERTPAQEDLSHDLSTLNITTPPSPPATDDSDSDGEWITPSNLGERQAADSGLQTNSRTSTQTQMDVATMTIDFAMQNVLLQMNLNLLSTNMQRIKQLTSKVLRCHACFLIVKQMDKQFCPRCGGASLARVNCSTNAKGEFRLHLAKNYQYNKRGDRYSVPKPIAGTANGKWSGQGGGQGGWGRDLILTEDQKEFQKHVELERRSKGTRDLMDEDYLPGILTGHRDGRTGGRPKVGAGKNVNSKKRG